MVITRGTTVSKSQNVTLIGIELGRFVQNVERRVRMLKGVTTKFRIY